MSMPSNCERHPALRGAYIAYDAAGFAFRVTGQPGNWMARPSYLASAGDYRLFTGATLRVVAGKVGASKREEAAS